MPINIKPTDRRLFLVGSLLTLAGCQTVAPHGLSQADVKALTISEIGVSYPADTRVQFQFAAARWAKDKMPPQPPVAFDPADPNKATDTSLIEWGDKLKALSESPEAQNVGRAELAKIVKKQFEAEVLGKPGGPRLAKLDLVIRRYDVAGNHFELQVDAALIDKRSGARVLGTNEIVGVHTRAQAAYSPSLIGALVVVALVSLTNGMRGDPTIAVSQDAAEKFRGWLIKPS